MAANKKLARYQSMRDFSKTAEPSGRETRDARGRAAALCDPEARGDAACTTTSGSNGAGCSSPGR